LSAGGDRGDKPYHGCGWDASTGEKWPFVTHFVGCKPCAKDGHGSYKLSMCLSQMERAYNFADNQIWQQYGLRHASLTSSQLIQTLNPKP
jgi:xyloglucan 6-xylosyltransferase